MNVIEGAAAGVVAATVFLSGLGASTVGEGGPVVGVVRRPPRPPWLLVCMSLETAAGVVATCETIIGAWLFECTFLLGAEYTSVSGNVW